MARSRLFLLFLVVLVALALPSAGMAKRFTYTTGFQVQNLSSQNQATISLEYYNNQKASTNPGQLATSASDKVDPNKSNTYFPIHAAPGFDGSVVVSSSEQVASIVNLLGSSGTTFMGSASYIGASAGSTTVQLPLLMKGNARGNIDTWFSVQNAGSEKTTVTVNYSDGTSSTPQELAGNASVVFDQQLETHTQTVFAATVTSSASLPGTTQQPLVAVVVQETSGGMILAYTGFASGSKLPVFPLVNAQPAKSLQTGITVRNMDPTNSSAVTIEYVPENNGPRCTETRTIAPLTVQTFALEIFAGAHPTGVTTTCTVGATFKMVGSAYVKTNSNNVDLVGVVNQIAPTAGSAYSGFDPNSANNKVVFPLIMDRNAGYFTSITVMSLNAGSTAVTCTYADMAATYNDTATLGQFESMVKLQNNKFPAKYVGSAVCSSTDPAAKLVGVVNEVAPGTTTDTVLTYEGINPK